MRNHYKQVLKVYFHDKVFRARVELDISQEEMAHRLALSSRSYVDLDHGESCCSAVTLALFLIYICTDPKAFLEELRYAFEAVRTTTH
jgi:DNA-binding XRE family transcriptional regulator